MKIELTKKQEALRESTRKFVDREIIPHARDNDINEHFPMDTMKKLGEEGFLGAVVPGKYGGSGLDYISEAIILEEIGRGCFSIRTAVSVQASLVEYALVNWGTEEQKQEYLPRLCKGEILGCFALTEAGAGSDASSIKTAAHKKGNGWVINGAKAWIGNGGIADMAIVFARTGPSKGHKGISAFIVEEETPGFTTQRITGKLGLRASNTARLYFDHCTLPGDALLWKVGDGFRLAMATIDNGRYGVAAGCVGIIDSCIEASVKYAKRRRQFGRPIGSFQLVQDMIARMVVDRDAARLLVYRAGHLKNKGVRNTLETSIAKYFASEAAVRAATDAVQIHGAEGYTNKYPVERHLRDAKVATIYEGTSQIQKLIIGEHILGIKAFV